MSIPDYQSIMLPLLRLAGDGGVHTFRGTVEALSQEFKLTEAERKELLPSGKQPTFANRVGWARTYMAKAGLLESPRRGLFKITERGLEVLRGHPDDIDVSFLEQFEDFVRFRELRHERPANQDEDGEQTTAKAVETSIETPEEVLESAYAALRQGLAADVLDTVSRCSPEFFERLVVDLLVRMGYGGSRTEAGQAIGRSGDEGIDGIIKEDRLGLDIIYIQAKRWEGVVGRPELQKFAGALQGQRARKGIFLTTSSFSREATDFVRQIDSKIILIDGQRLANLMIEHGVGVTTEATYELKRIDTDYFSEE
ncbi:MAG: restriction endonuclease [Gammaproteobacteria bacterium]